MISQDQEKVKELSLLLRDLSDAISDLKQYYFLILFAYTIDDMGSSFIDDDSSISPEENYNRTQVLLGIFIEKCSPKHMRDIAEAIHEAHKLFQSLIKD